VNYSINQSTNQLCLYCHRAKLLNRYNNNKNTSAGYQNSDRLITAVHQKQVCTNLGWQI